MGNFLSSFVRPEKHHFFGAGLEAAVLEQSRQAGSGPARVPSQEFVVPHLISGSKLLEPLRVTESAGHIVLHNLTDTRFEFFHSGMAARQ